MTPENRHLYCPDQMALAAERLTSAHNNLAMGDFKVAISQSYYAMFHAASALLAARDIHRRRHGGVKAAFIQQFCKTGDIELQLTTGVHGPGEWHVIVIRQAFAPAGTSP